ncbi:MAG: AAA family ATPase, partial [Patescibacteria group bacterium]
SSIEYLAMISNNEVQRFNLNGQTDTSELIGKFVPNDEGLQTAFAELLRSYESLSEKSQAILKRANSEGRGMTKIESQQIAEAEGLKIPDWRWQDGLDVRAKKKGQWLILDEINLAEAQILERINSELEKHPTLTLSENGGTVIRELDEEEMQKYKNGDLPGVEPLNPNFRIFATMNPAEYHGRQPMSPAYKDRWTSYKFVGAPKAKDYVDMMNLMVYGWQPEISLHGVKYKPQHTESMLPTLEKIPNFRSFIPKLAKFQETVEDLARKREIGRSKKEPYIFTRRGVIEFLTYLETKTMIDRKTRSRISIADAPEVIISRAMQYYYLDKISNHDDLRKVKMHLDALGISENNWTHKFK